MEYNEYKAPKGKVLFNVENFTYGNTMLSVHDLNLIVLDKEEAEQLYQEYLKKQNETAEAEQNEVQDNPEEQIQTFSSRMRQANISTMSLNEDGEYEVDEESDSMQESAEDDSQKSPLELFKKDKIADLLVKGVSFDQSKINCIKQTTKYI